MQDCTLLIHIVAFWTDILRCMPGGYQRYGKNHASSFSFALQTEAANYINSKGWYAPTRMQCPNAEDRSRPTF